MSETPSEHEDDLPWFTVLMGVEPADDARRLALRIASLACRRALSGCSDSAKTSGERAVLVTEAWLNEAADTDTVREAVEQAAVFAYSALVAGQMRDYDAVSATFYLATAATETDSEHDEHFFLLIGMVALAAIDASADPAAERASQRADFDRLRMPTGP